MAADAEKYATDDAKKKEAAEARNMAETLAYSTEKMVKDNESKIKEEDKNELNGKIEAVRNALKGESVDEIKKATEELSKSAQKVGGSLYQAQQTPPNPEQSQEPPKT